MAPGWLSWYSFQWSVHCEHFAKKIDIMIVSHRMSQYEFKASIFCLLLLWDLTAHILAKLIYVHIVPNEPSQVWFAALRKFILQMLVNPSY